MTDLMSLAALVVSLVALARTFRRARAAAAPVAKPVTVYVPVADDGLLVAQQRFFTELATAIQKPHYGIDAKGWAIALLIRAEEAGLYKPEGN